MIKNIQKLKVKKYLSKLIIIITINNTIMIKQQTEEIAHKKT